MASSADIFAVTSSRTAVPPGATLAVFMQPVAGQGSWTLKNFSGGTLEIFGATITTTGAGSTLPAADLVSLSGTGYLFGALEVLSITGPASFYLSSLSATTVVMVVRGKSAGL